MDNSAINIAVSNSLKDVVDGKVVVNGELQNIAEGWVVVNGVWKRVWPPTIAPMVNSEPSILTPSAGLIKASDNTPLTGSVLTERADLIDGNKTVSGMGDWDWHSIGVDLGESKTITKINLYCRCDSAPTTRCWFNADCDSIGIYSSDDNSTWVLEENFDNPSYELGNTFVVSLTPASPITARYLKAHPTGTGAYGYGLCAGAEVLGVKPCEIEIEGN